MGSFCSSVALIETFTEGHHIREYEDGSRGKMDSYGINLIVKTTREGDLEMSEKEVRSLLNSFIGRSVKEFLFSEFLLLLRGITGE